MIGLAWLGLGTGTNACKKADGTSSPTTRSTSARRGGGPAAVALPDPFPLPDRPATLVWLADPGAVATAVNQISPAMLDAPTALQWELGRELDEPWARTFSEVADVHRPWAAVELDVSDGQAPREAIVILPVVAARRDALAESMAALPAAGRFGAVQVPARPTPGDGARPPRSTLAWSPDGGTTLVLATSERGLMTAAAVPNRYGTRSIVAHVEIDRLHLGLPDADAVPFERVHVEGELGDLAATLTLAPDAEDPFAAFELGPGALAHLLAFDEIATGGSARWLGYEREVKRVIGRVAAQVDEAPFLIKGWASDLAAKFNAIARSWNGRVALGSAAGHVMFAYGSDDPQRSGVAVTRFLREAIDGLSLAASFVGSLPDVTFKKRADRVGEVDVHRVTIKNARSVVGPEAAPLLDDRGNLSVAMAFPPGRGAGMIVVGPDPVPRLGAWLTSTAGGRPIDPGTGDDAPLGALRWALSGDQLRGLASGRDLAAWLDARPTIPPYDVAIHRRDPRTVVAHISGPPAPPPPRSIAGADAR